METEQNIPTINELDNENTIIYKYVAIMGYPTKLIFLNKEDVRPDMTYMEGLQNIKAEYIGDMVQGMIEAGRELEQIDNEFDTLDLRDVFMLFLQNYLTNMEDVDPEELDVYIKNIVNIARSVYRKIGSSLGDYDDLLSRFREWSQNMRQIYNQDLKRYRQIVDSQTLLLEIDPLVISYPIFNKITIRANMATDTNMIPSVDDGIDIFNESMVSYDVPYIQYNKDDRKLYKVYKGRKYDFDGGKTNGTTLNYGAIIPSSNINILDNSIYLTIWSGQGDPTKATQKSYGTSVYRLKENSIVYSSPITLYQDETDISNKIETALNLTVVNKEDIKTSGFFNIYGVVYDEITLTDFITTDQVMSSYLYINESGVSYPYKKRLKIHYRSVTGGLFDDDDEEPSEGEPSPSSVTISLVQEYTTITEMLSLVNPANIDEEEEYEVEKGTPYIRVNVDKAVSRQTAIHFSNVFSRLLTLYGRNRDALLNTYQQFIPDLNQVIRDESPQGSGPLVKKTKGGRKPTGILPGQLTPDFLRRFGDISKLDLIWERSGNVGLEVGNFTRKVQKRHQPLMLVESEVEAWENETFINDLGEPENYQVMRFRKPDFLLPGQNNKSKSIDTEFWYFVCPHQSFFPTQKQDEMFPYPNLKINDSIKPVTINGITKQHQEWFPYLPICGKKLKTEPFLRPKVRERKPKSTKYKITSMKVLDPGREGSIQTEIEKLLNVVLPKYEFIRFGVPLTPNSLIHSVFEAMSGSSKRDLIPNEYFGTNDEEEREQIVREFRRDQLLNHIRPGLLRQELYNSTELEIVEMIRDVDRFFDPALFYRSLEEYFDVNIYVFTPTDDEKEPISIEIPNFNQFHARPMFGGTTQDRGSIIIYKHEGTKSEKIPQPQCEFIFARLKSETPSTRSTKGRGRNSKQNSTRGSDIRVFDGGMNELLYNLVNETSKSVTWNISPFTNEPVARTNLYSMIQLSDIFKLKPAYQIIDPYGKLRGLVYVYQGKALTVMGIPSRPENLETIDKSDPFLLQKPTIDEVLTLFSGNTATAVTRSLVGAGRNPAFANMSNDMVDGIWLKIFDIPYGVYTPFESIPIEIFVQKVGPLPIGPPNPVFTGNINVIDRTRKLRRTLEIIMQLIYWSFIVSRLNVGTFIEDYLELMETGEIDSANIYDLTGIERKLPRLNTIDEVMEYLNERIPTLVRDGKFQLYSEKFKRGISFFIKQYDHVTKGLPRIIPKELTGLYQEETDFIQYPNTAIFLNELDMRSWLETIRRESLRFISIRTQLLIEYSAMVEPYIYMSQNEDNNIYLIQNVAGDKSSAINVAYNWYTERINLGYLAPPYKGTSLYGGTTSLIETGRGTPRGEFNIPAHFVYNISNRNQPFARLDFSGDEDKFLQILAYSENKYAAMLPIL